MSWMARSGATLLLLDFKAHAGWRLAQSIGLMLAGALAEGFGILMLVPLIASATDIDVLPEALRFLMAPLQSLTRDQRFLAGILLFVGAMLVRSLLLHARDMAVARVQADYEASLQLRAAGTLAVLGWPAASRIGQAGMQSLLLTEVSHAAMGVGQAQAAAVAVILLTVQFVIAALLSPGMAAIALVILVGGYFTTRRWTARGLRSGLAMSERYEESSEAGFRLHAGLKAALAQGTISQFLDEYRASLDRLTRELVQFAGDQSRARAMAAIGAAVAAALVLTIGDRLFQLEFPVLAAVLVLFSRMAAPAQRFQQATQELAAYAPAFLAIEQRLGRLHSEPLDAPVAKPLQWTELRAEQLAYEHSPGIGLRDASFVLRPGEWLGVSGGSGEGKTTLIDLVAGLARPQHGTLTIDGRPLDHDILPCWRATLAYVGQGDAMFNDTIRANLLADVATCDENALWETLEIVALAARVRALPLGLNQQVGDRGSGLSGGERQRLTLARAILRRPSLMILDEATSALDIATEKLIVERLRALVPRPAAIIVAHRSAIIGHCELVAIVADNRLRLI
ncbi:MAG: ABC transporter ATP-binding protein [Sphingomicrobium sp.]